MMAAESTLAGDGQPALPAQVSAALPSTGDSRIPVLAAEFLRCASCYWLTTFPLVVFEIRRIRALAARIPDRRLRDLAAVALDRKVDNLEGAAALATLAPRTTRARVVRALVACQAICDYLDVLCEQPSEEPAANGYALHEALLDAVTWPQRGGRRDYYRRNRLGDDGGYLTALSGRLRDSLSALPTLRLVAPSLVRAAVRVAAYQALNHPRDRCSDRSFERWSERQRACCPDLRWWEAGAAAGSTLNLHALIAVAADRRVEASDVGAIDEAYFPWIGALHSLLDSLLDYDEDLAAGAPLLIDCYSSPAEAAARMGWIARISLARALELRHGRRHALIVAAMTSFYLCERRCHGSALAGPAAPAVLDALGGLGPASMAVLRLRRAVRCGSRDRVTPGVAHRTGKSSI